MKFLRQQGGDEGQACRDEHGTNDEGDNCDDQNGGWFDVRHECSP
ncbi:MAG: hypothetical protein ACJ0RB_04850 [Candidatus Azotimanducaceae bacterium]